MTEENNEADSTEYFVRLKAHVQVMSRLNSLLVEMDEAGDYYKLKEWVEAEGRIVRATLRVMGQIAETIESLVVDKEKRS